jgi:branched-chain amino acid transport system ATP-binding protein
VLQNNPNCLLVDEPSLGLSPKMQDDIFGKLAELRDAGVTIIAVEQNVRGALAVSDNAAVLVQGEIVMHGPAADINNDERIRKAYLGG